MKTRWMLKRTVADIKSLARESGVSEIVATCLANRGMKEGDKIKKFINPSLHDLRDPFLMKDMKKAVQLIVKAIKEKKKIMIVGDYDVDGVISTFLLYTSLQKCDAIVNYHIPDRITEGYGINESIVRGAKDQGVDVIITCDNGIAAIKQIKLAKELGMTVIVTDHHDIPFEEVNGERKLVIPEADAVLNPKQQDCEYPFKSLCGAGVVFKFIQVLYTYMGIGVNEAYKFLEYVAIATVCDVVDLIDENRIIVKNGLERINNTENIGVTALIEETGLQGKEITVYSLGFVIGPCINASGRLEQALWALKLFISKDPEEAQKLAQKLYTLNKERQDMTNVGVERTIEIIENSNVKKDKVFVVYVPEIHESIAGIIAGRIRERYNVPTFILTSGKEVVKGSGRSIEEYSMFEEMLKCKELLGNFGGHPMAAGLSIKEENIDSFRLKLNKECTVSEEELMPKISIDMQIPFERISMELAKELRLLEPFGKGNSKMLFAEKNIKIARATILGAKKNVLKFRLISKSQKFVEAIYFGDIEEFNRSILESFGKYEVEKMYNGNENNIIVDFIFAITINEYAGKETVQLTIANYRMVTT